jgi:hypothetical protein
MSAEVSPADLSPTLELGAESGTTTGWAGSNSTVTNSTEQAKFGSRSYKLVSIGANAFPTMTSTVLTPVTAGQQYRISAWLFAPVALPGNAFLDILWRNSSGTYLTESVLTASVPAGAWKYVEGTYTAPATAATGTRIAGIQTNPTPAGTALYVENLQIRPLIDSGDLAATLRDQYIGAMAEMTEVVRR